MIDQMNESTAQANDAIDKALQLVAASNERIIRRETALEIGLSRSGPDKPARRIGHKAP